MAIVSTVTLPNGYRPNETEPFMNGKQREYFRQRLVSWRTELMRESSTTLQNLQEDQSQPADIADRASMETERSRRVEDPGPGPQADRQDRRGLGANRGRLLRFLHRDRGADRHQRLDARPIATLSLEAQERHERRERSYRDD